MYEAKHTPPRHYLDWANRGKPALWRYAVALLVAVFIWVFGAIPEVLLLPSVYIDPTTKPVGMLYAFLPGLLGILALTWLVLGRPAHSVFSPNWPPRWRDYGIGILITLLITAIITAATFPYFNTEIQGFGNERKMGLGLILIMLLGFVIQTAFDEVLFRGLLMQFARRLTSWAPLILLPQAILFAIPHFGNVSAWNSDGLIAVLPYFVTALTWGWVAWRTGSLMMTMGLHFANNSFNTFLVGSKGDLVASYAPIVQDMPSLPITIMFGLVQAVITIAAVEFVVRRRSTATAVDS